ncbi:hypothetical protein [Actinomadura sp. WAC 06369]|uniref:hypothetical protein n=1 Tax=Actinomadura sp. WAC 06369 TaxID=2203193 RepID=UPI000F76942C|nr:hypothetical protein [Actinomadura sp. WAC 06369]RSN50854.1 hypothetical protein DMH08_31860 [Actinomadura sp. WAC 06369]
MTNEVDAAIERILTEADERKRAELRALAAAMVAEILAGQPPDRCGQCGEHIALTTLGEMTANAPNFMWIHRDSGSPFCAAAHTLARPAAA